MSQAVLLICMGIVVVGCATLVVYDWWVNRWQ